MHIFISIVFNNVVNIHSYNTILIYNNNIIKQIGEEIAYRLNIFKNVKVFTHVDLEDLHLLAKSLEVVYYKKGEYLINQGDEGYALYILEGKFKFF